ncbi:MAG: cytochrome C oxidase subunit II [Chloroflexi bacterium]|nr:cytochrome C oxidase subunit II [Chloroflexota bacterium]
MMLAPQRVWWQPLSRMERSWVIVAFVLCLFFTAMMPFWFVVGRQNVPVTTYRVDPKVYEQVVNDFIAEYKVDEINGIPVVEPPPGGEIYMLARQWQWSPILKLKKGETYKLHLSSTDILHGFSLQPTNMNLMVMPGYDYVAEITPTQVGEYAIVCNEYCGIGHHLMVTKLIVTD